MDDKIVSINGDYSGELKMGEPNEIVISHLEKLLEKAKSGAIQGIVTAQLYSDGTTSWGTHGFIGGHSLTGALSVALNDVIKGTVEG